MAGNPFFVTIVERRIKWWEKQEEAFDEQNEDNIDWDFSTLKDSVQIMKARSKRKEYTSEDPLTKASFGNLRDSVALVKKRVKIREEDNKIKLIENNATLNQMARVKFEDLPKPAPIPVSPPSSASKPILKKQSPTTSESKPTPLPAPVENSSTPECKQQ